MNNKAISIIKEFEGLKFDAYLDAVGRPTIGYGTATKDVKLGMIWTLDQCEKALVDTVDFLEREIRGSLEVSQTDDQVAALISFAYNLGLSRLTKSTLFKKINNHANPQDIASEFLLWDHVGNKVLLGLEKRRKAERELYLS